MKFAAHDTMAAHEQDQKRPPKRKIPMRCYGANNHQEHQSYKSEQHK